MVAFRRRRKQSVSEVYADFLKIERKMKTFSGQTAKMRSFTPAPEQELCT